MSTPASPDESGVTTSADATGAQQYFSDVPTVPSQRSTVRLDLPDRTLQLVTDRGVFSSSRVDPGTKLLLLELPELAPGTVVDVGCGYGPIACTVAARQPGAQVWGVDVNSRARELTELNAATLGLEVHVCAPEQVPEDLVVDTIVSNPPIRIGKAALHELMSTWLDRLAPEGEAWLVVQKHLGADSLAAWMTSRGHEVERTRSRQGYRILRVAARAPDA